MRLLRALIPACFLLIPLAVSAQKIPEGYSMQEGTNGVNQIRADLDSDGKTDFVAIISDKYQTYVYVALQDGKKTLMSKNAPSCCSYLEMKKNILVLHSVGMRGFMTWRFRFNAGKNDLQLIGMDTESLGNAMQDGAGTSSLNMLTGNFVAKYQSWNKKRKRLIALPVIRKRLRIDRPVFLTDFGEATDDVLLDLMHKELPKEIQ